MTRLYICLILVIFTLTSIKKSEADTADCSKAGQGNAIRDLTTQFAALQSKFQDLQEQKNLQDEEMRRLKSSQASTDQQLRNLQQAYAKSVSSTRPAAFMARNTGTQSVAQGTLITFRNVIVNIGGFYSPSSSKFTCPDHGVYVFVTTILSNDRAATYFAIVQEGHAKGSGYTGSGVGKGSATEMAVIKCRPGSKIWVMCHAFNQHYNQKAWFHSYFGGFRL